jgi:hypothetical protein
MDHSIRYDSFGFKVVIFWPEEHMPSVSGVADVVLIRNIKVSDNVLFSLFFILTHLGPDAGRSYIAHSP